jgi:hypothetical protein
VEKLSGHLPLSFIILINFIPTNICPIWCPLYTWVPKRGFSHIRM